MTNQETYVTNAFETTLSSGLSAGATTINVDSTAGTPAVPFYAVIEPANDSNREVVLVDSGKTATTLTLTAASKRGLDGTSDVAHDSGVPLKVVPVAALWTDINDRVEGHTHTGTTDGATIATADLTGHDQAAHNALNIDADTVDGSHAADLLDRANHTGTQPVSTLSDHTKATHDALGIDAATLDGLDSTAFAAVAGDTFTGAVTFQALSTFEAGVEGNLGADVHAVTDDTSAWPTGLSWQQVTTGSWPTTNGLVYTFNFGNNNQTFQVFIGSTVGGGDHPQMHLRKRNPGSNTWHEWEQVTMAGDPGSWEVDGSAEVGGPISPTTSDTQLAAVTLAIPSDWNSWKCEAYATGTYGQSGGGGPPGRYFKIDIDGTDQQELFVSENDGVTRPWSVGGRRTGMTTTGNRTVKVEHRVTATGESPRASDIYLYARAVRTS